MSDTRCGGSSEGRPVAIGEETAFGRSGSRHSIQHGASEPSDREVTEKCRPADAPLCASRAKLDAKRSVTVAVDVHPRTTGFTSLGYKEIFGYYPERRRSEVCRAPSVTD